MRHLWAPIAANLVVGVSPGLPLFLYLREKRLEVLVSSAPPRPGQDVAGDRTRPAGPDGANPAAAG